ncbi:uncharacterized protein LOC107721055 [Sinocyclocheilus rhinocerous]|uniref:uncharacterized protein LOC107721055 n=1 Tax=Sinocyclocheilus rhinocerous TaxID=307959 RepID=UPI0007B8FF2F|nr:PREDICTED: uncharacterized protein LOC107721055 [Sinocyclocheilus rhinocerous]
MASRDPSTQGLKVKFLINIPLKVDSEDEAQKMCRYLLDALIEGFTEEDRKFMRDGNGRQVLEDVAVIFGMNRKHTPELVQDLDDLERFRYDCKIRYSIITYTWGSGGTIASEVPDKTIPYQDIREYLKSHAATTNLVRELRGNDRSCLVYFSFVDSDTFSFNSIYSEYLQIVRKELKNDPPIPPTVMSTGYEFTHEQEHHIAGDLDRQIRTALAEVNALFVYYPEPNFCVLVEEEKDTIEESFIIKKNRGKNDYKMESCILIRQVKERVNFKAMFGKGKPIIIVAPERFKLSKDGLILKGLIINQSTLNKRNLASGAYCNGLLKCRETYNGVDLPNDPKTQLGVYYKNLNFIKDLYKCSDERSFEELSKKNPFSMDGGDATELVEAIRQARECRKVFEELDKNF